jgi:hypothetical protein
VDVVEPELPTMKHAAVWAAATILAAAAVICLPSRSAQADGQMKVGKSGRIYVWRPGEC